MITHLTEEERGVWKDVYSLHEKYHDMKGTSQEWMRFAQEVGPLVVKHEGRTRRLAEALIMALFDFMDKERKIELDAAMSAPQQVTLEEIPWT